MRFATISPENQQRLAVLVPLIALFLSLFIVYPAWGRYQELRANNDKLAKDLARVKSLPIPEPGPVRPAVAYLPSEPPQFLAHISALAAAAHCEIRGFEEVRTAKTDADKGPVLPLRAKIELEVPYPRVREFLALVAQADRLYVVAAVDQSVGSIGGNVPLKTTITIERYVNVPKTAEAPPKP